MSIPTICIVGWANSGKTTLIEKLIPALAARGLTAGVVKHDVHGMDMDREGKDTWRYTHAGAPTVAIISPGAAALIENRTLRLNDMLPLVRNVDVILVEGFDKEACLPMIEVRRDESQPLRAPLKWLRAVVSDSSPEAVVPVFSPSDTEKIAEFVQKLALEQKTPETTGVTVKLNGQDISMVPFVSRLVSSVSRGVLSQLDGYREDCEINIHISGKKD
jgi:molybdopterin-guanine dinucleotide biosynthesis protein B